jgi:crotonobetainyl-CoA:carnitine CoA-transferase CaiB-like acyl-CoA transferase
MYLSLRQSLVPTFSIGDTLAGMHAAFGTVLALLARNKVGGQTVDASIYESVFSLMEGVLCEYDGQGQVRQPSGSTVTGIVPTGTYPTKDGKSVVIGANSDTLFKRLMVEMGQHAMAESPMYIGNQNRVTHQVCVNIKHASRELQTSVVLGCASSLVMCDVIRFMFVYVPKDITSVLKYIYIYMMCIPKHTHVLTYVYIYACLHT